MLLCAACYLQGYCRRLKSQVVAASELTPDFIRNFRAYTAAKDLRSTEWPDFLTHSYRDYPGEIVDGTGAAIDLDTRVFNPPNIRTWFRDFICKPCAPSVTPRVRKEAVERVTVTASILRAIDPVQASLWGRTPANDEASPPLPFHPPLLRQDCPCPYVSQRAALSIRQTG